MDYMNKDLQKQQQQQQYQNNIVWDESTKQYHDLRFQSPFCAILSGPSKSGKSTFIDRILRNINQMCNVQFDEIIYCYSYWQDLFTNLLRDNICKFHQGLPTIEDFENKQSKPRLIILDDLMAQANDEVTDLFTKSSHHLNISVFFLSQNLFFKSKGSRDMSLNTNYFVCFKNPRDQTQFKYLARQVYPQSPQFLQESYEDSTSKPHGYLLLDLKQSTPDKYRFSTNIFPGEIRTFYTKK